MPIERLPVVVPPPTPAKTGTFATEMAAWVMTSSGVKGYTTIRAFPLWLRMMEMSVVKMSDLILRLIRRIPDAL